MAVYDNVDWHVDSAVAAGQPPEHGFTHIGFYLGWLIRRDLHEPTFFPRSHVEALKRGEVTGSDLADDIDNKLVSDVMGAEGSAFSEACYAAYLTEYSELFNGVPEYGVADDPANYERVERLLDRLYADWVAAGRPEGSHEPAFEGELQTPGSVEVMLPPGMSEEQLKELMGEWPHGDVVVMPPPTEDDMPHVAPQLEALIPRDLTSPPMQVSSINATHWGSSLLNRALKRLGIRPRDVIVASGVGGFAEGTLSVSIYGVADVPADRLEVEFATVIFAEDDWQRREVAGRQVNWAAGNDFKACYWAHDGIVLHVAGESDAVERAVGRLP